jgi:Cu-Zn family superoxide dismutase
MRLRWMSLLLVLLPLFVVAIVPTKQGYCKLFATTLGAAYNIQGTVTFSYYAPTGEVTVNVSINSTLPDNDYAIHVHTFGDLTDVAGGVSAGAHYVGAGNTTHACPDNPNRHEGDMGNWQSVGGVISQIRRFGLLALSGDNSIIGRAVVLHELADDCVSQPAGAAGSRLAFCVIGLADVDFNEAAAGGAGGDAPTYSRAVCVLQPTSNCGQNCPSVAGSVWFEQNNTLEGGLSTVITAQVQGLARGSVHSIKIHEYGDWSSMDGSSAGNHYNPFGRTHQLPPVVPRHIGDLGNIQSYDTSTGNAWYQMSDGYMPALSNLYGRSVLIASGRDHGAGRGCTRGSPGPDILMCVIGIANPSTVFGTVPNGVTIDNNFKDQNCESGDGVSGAYVAFAWVGWTILFVEAILLVVAGIFYLYWKKKRNSPPFGYQDV